MPNNRDHTEHDPIRPRKVSNGNFNLVNEEFPVQPNIGELDLPYIEGFDTASFTFGDAAPQQYELGAIHYLKEPMPAIPQRGSTLKVISELIGSGKTTVNYFFYDLDEVINQYTFYRSESSDGADAEACGFVNMYTTSEDNTSLNAKGANDGGSPIIIIGTINIDPTFLGQVAN